jgi:hypothetical protein
MESGRVRQALQTPPGAGAPAGAERGLGRDNSIERARHRLAVDVFSQTYEPVDTQDFHPEIDPTPP